MRRFYVKGSLIFVIAISLLISGCSSIFDFSLRNTVDPDEGAIKLSGLHHDVIVRRDKLGIPVVFAENFQDLAFATGYVMASNRLAQMVSFSLLGQGRLAEMAGTLALDMDIYVRTLGVPDAARQIYAHLSSEIKDGLVAFSDGVNAYLMKHQDQLPLDFILTGYTPEPWKPEDSIYISTVFNMGLSFNVSEEIAFLNIAKALGPKKAAWLVPIYPDEPLSFEKADVLSEIDFGKLSKITDRLVIMHEKFTDVAMPLGIAASNNWGVSPKNTLQGASIIANDTHLPLEHPSLWMLIHMKCPDYDVAGIAIAGVPGVVAGYNGHIAWGETMVMGDNQDVFIEKIKEINGSLYYLYKDEWLLLQKRKETFKVKGRDNEVRNIFFTHHGPLLNSALTSEPIHLALPPKVKMGYGLALQSVIPEVDGSFEAMFNLTRAKDMASANQSIRNVRSMALNFIYGDKDHIAWQVTGRYPNRKSGRGHLPSPGWTGVFEWDGYAEVDEHPYEFEPESGFLATANNRTILPGQGLILSSSWYAPERTERIRGVLMQDAKHTWKESLNLQNDRADLFVNKLKQVLFDSSLWSEIKREIDSWQDENKIARANEAISILNSFDGHMAPRSTGAAVFGIFRHIFIQHVFYDELGPEDSPAWKSFMSVIQAIYSADQDHILGRRNSPFWDNINTQKTETKADIIADVLADTIVYAEDYFGEDRQKWEWGRLLTYTWKTQATQMRPFMAWWERLGVDIIGGYTDRGPFPAGGSYNTTNVGGFYKGKDFNVWLETYSVGELWSKNVISGGPTYE